ncbi:hypothetical protein [Bartonella sp. F02]|uniref:hypothetical protein n=1 Tax=Bartonella sp. F02 TaxID=2967262 RepID=UPI0022A96A40|nr:hypothetical protein [Bartonella sp. F02]MCZ2328923.1 hypothetical protein [Bartonella sp. F02]
MTLSQMSPWYRLTQLPNGKGVKAEWQNFPENLLEQTTKQAENIPCNQCSNYMKVVHHSTQDIVGVCTSEIGACDKRKLHISELAIYQINHKELATKIAASIGFTEQLEQIKEQFSLWKLGSLNPHAAYKFSVYCFLGNDSSQLEKIVNHLRMTEENPFVLIVPTKSIINQNSYNTSNKHQYKLLEINDVLSVDATGKAITKDSAKTIITDWSEIAISKSTKLKKTYFKIIVDIIVSALKLFFSKIVMPIIWIIVGYIFNKYDLLDKIFHIIIDIFS